MNQFFVVGGDIFRLDNGDELASANIKVISNELVIGNLSQTIVVHQQFPLAAGTLKNSVFLVFAFVNIDGRIPGGSLAISVCQQSGWIPRSGGICHGQEGSQKKGCQQGTPTKK